MYGEFETKMAPIYSNLIRSISSVQRINDDTRTTIIKMFSNISARNVHNVYENEQNNVLSSLFTLELEDENVDRRTMQNLVAIANGAVVSDEACGLMEKLSTYNIQILVSNKPNIVYSDCIIEQMFYRNLYFPLTPYMVAFFPFAYGYEDKVVRKITQDEYNEFVNCICNHKYVNRIFASNKETLEQVKAIIEC